MVSIQETIIEQTAIGATIFRQTCKKSLILIDISSLTFDQMITM